MITLNGDSGITAPTYGGTVASEYHVPVTAFKNRIINGGQTIDQRNAGASVTLTAGASNFITDRWGSFVSQSSKATAQQNAGSVTPPTGFTNYLGVTSSSAYTVGSSEIFNLNQKIEGYNIADLGWGTASASPVTISFWVRSSLTGTFGGSVICGGSCPFSYTINSANTWELKSVTIPANTSYAPSSTTNGQGIYLGFGIGVGSAQSGTAGAWSASYYYSATGATSVVGTNGATFYITGVQLEKGSTATSFDYRPYGTELQLCQRYYWKMLNDNPSFTSFGTGVIGTSTNLNRGYTALPVKMRAVPTIGYSSLRIYDGTVAASVTSLSDNFSSTNVGSYQMVASAGGLTLGRAGILIENGSSAYLDFTAEL